MALGEVQGAREDRAAPPPTHWSEIPTKTYVPADRLGAMDEDGIDAQTFFPNIAGINNGTFQTIGTEDYRLACIRAYNDWQAEEWYGFSPRFVPQCIFPLWDIRLAVAEVTRCHELGHRGIVGNPNPDLLSLPHLNDPYWDPLWATCQELGLVVSFHVGGGGPVSLWGGYTQNQSIAVRACRIIAGNSLFMANVLYSGILERFPRLKVFSAESGIGWIPYLLETADHQFEAQKLWREGQETRPSELFHRQCYSSFWYEKAALKLRHEIGLSNIVWEGDFPHRTCTYPDSRRYIEDSLLGVPDDERRTILAENAIALFNLDGGLARTYRGEAGMTSVFAGIAVVDLTQGMAGPMAAMILADNGAEVIKVEPPSGDWARALPGFLMWNRGKKSVVLNLNGREADDMDAARHLVEGADVVLSSFRPGSAAASALDPNVLTGAYPGLVHCTISGFGLARGYEHVRAYEAIVAAKSGRMRGNDGLSGTRHPDAANRPIYIAAPMGSYGAALLAVQGIAAALFARARTGRGQRVETSLLDGLCATTMRLRFQRHGDQVLPDRKAPGRELMLRGISLTFLTPECQDGRYIQMCARQDHHFRNWMAALGLSDLMEQDRFAGAPMGFKSESDVDELETLIRERMLQRTQAEWMQLFIEKFDVGADPFLTPQEFLAHPQMQANERIVELDDPVVGPVRQVGPLALFSETPSRIATASPALGEHQEMISSLTGAGSAGPAPQLADDAGKAPFNGLTILEVAYFLAGPLGTTLAAELGARVIKVEPLAGDPYRKVGLESVHIIAGKESIAVDLEIRGRP